MFFLHLCHQLMAKPLHRSYRSQTVIYRQACSIINSNINFDQQPLNFDIAYLSTEKNSKWNSNIAQRLTHGNKITGAAGGKARGANWNKER